MRYADEFLNEYRLLGKQVEGKVFDLELSEDPEGQLKEVLRRNAAGADPAPDASDEVLYRRFIEQLKGEKG